MSKIKPPDVSPEVIDAQRIAERIMADIAALTATIRMHERLHKEQIGEITDHLAQVLHPLNTRLAALQLDIRPHVRLLVDSDPLSRKSVTLRHGVTGWADHIPGTTIDDNDAVVEWLEANDHADMVRVRVTKAPKLTAIKERFPIRGNRYVKRIGGTDLAEIIPGLTVNDPGDGFYVKPTATREEP